MASIGQTARVTRMVAITGARIVRATQMAAITGDPAGAAVLTVLAVVDTPGVLMAWDVLIVPDDRIRTVPAVLAVGQVVAGPMARAASGRRALAA